jgi:hypothetical protein
MENAHQQAGTATATPGQAGIAENVTLAPFALNEQQAKELRNYRHEAITARVGDNALAVLLVGRANWTPTQVQELLGMEASSVARACKNWQEQGIAGIRNLPPASYRS